MVFVQFADADGDSSDMANITVTGMNGSTVRASLTKYYFVPDGKWIGPGTHQVTVKASDIVGNRMENVIWTFSVMLRYDVSMEVVGQDGEPLQDVRVVLGTGQEFWTSSGGTLTMELLDGYHSMVLIKEGYDNYELNLTVHGEGIDLGTLEMVPSGDSGSDGNGEASTLAMLIATLVTAILVIGTVLVMRYRRSKQGLPEE
jgi:hypothetical protein